ncbi:precorrin-6y C5,15-methyltransferase (decarboxylating) subunit CbiE [Sporomusa acidovorans]|uniref:Cobalamin biosynthesis bifunctional protein CbiET n=1 Tax=Sporomusa acidovorans (strain ATCC 49682 / DSM 3132 / Mol) TaxID=1123286 RepID=A0ABZ3J1W8_SPOA4|nr:precorrin-6y C5,15-methyltransferase (decarboxylating) subunit CbiE [Sporomusa acidovorans]OZC15049.1 putative cobalt-precorrin-6Y C(5)-methyltransferase [Sporomusa acidovorans DSM 3132]SDE84653.1 precorrin-6Y C5,15-methyltransferase (decarboxylating) [Sporomusa acidovorans]
MECAYRIIVVGIGPGSADYLLPAASRTIKEAVVLVGSKRALATFASENQLTKVIDKDIGGVLDFVEQQLNRHDVVVMVSGDPGFYSMLTALRKRFSPDCLTVIPGISSVQLAFARLAEVWQDAALISMHGREVDDAVLCYRPGYKLGILTDNQHNPANIADILLTHGWPKTASVWLCANLSYDNESIIAVNLAEARRTPGFEHSVMVVKA